VRSLLHQRSDDPAQRQQGLVDVSCFTSTFVHSSRAADVLTAGEIHLDRTQRSLLHSHSLHQRREPLPNTSDCYQVEFADLHQLLPVQRDLLHVDGDREHGVGATAETRQRTGEHSKLVNGHRCEAVAFSPGEYLE